MTAHKADNIQDALKNAVDVVSLSSRLAKHHLIIANHDGLNLYSNNSDKQNSTMGALLGGVWQASMALLSQENLKDLRLGFDDGENGFCIVDFKVGEKTCFACLMFKNEIAPGALRGQLRLWCDELSLQLKNWRPNKTSAGFLFKDVTDEEIDRLFGFEGNACRS